MRVLEYSEDSSSFNIAFEHTLIDLFPHRDELMTIRFWKNPSSVIIGRTQSLDDEVNIDYCEDNKIQVLRRLSAGGAVYNDEGNYNFTVLAPFKVFKVKNFSQQIRSIGEIFVKSLEENGITAYLHDSGSILSDGRKISGSAQYVRGNVLLHHFTLLVNANLKHLELALKGRESVRTRRKSLYMPTRNINVDVKAVQRTFLNFLTEMTGLNHSYDQATNDEIEYTKSLVTNLYETDNWLYFGKRNPKKINS